MTPDRLARALQEFLSTASSGVVMEDGAVVFELDSAQYSISADRGRCLLHLWSAERNVVREFAKDRPHRLEIYRDRDRRTPSIKKSTRQRYAQTLERIIRRQLPDWEL